MKKKPIRLEYAADTLQLSVYAGKRHLLTLEGSDDFGKTFGKPEVIDAFGAALAELFNALPEDVRRDLRHRLDAAAKGEA